MNQWHFLEWDDAISLIQKSMEEPEQAQLLEGICKEEAIFILRDWQGRITVCFPCARAAFLHSGLENWIQLLAKQLGRLAGAIDISLCKDEMFDPDDIWCSPNKVSIPTQSKLHIYLLDRQDKESDWLREISPQAKRGMKPRAVFFGIKGGVGRSSSITALALHLANQGKKVLVVDADFESPGVSSSLLGGVQPNFGLVDWMIAQALDCDSQLLEELAMTQIVETSPLSQHTKGKILVAPAHAKLTQSYVEKLGRVYRTTDEGLTYAEKLNTVITMLERSHEVDVTLIDCRAGIDDTAAAAITQLGARVTFLFAINTTQTWDAYKLLFRHLRHHPALHTEQDLRQTFRLVSALTPEEVGASVGYWENFQQRAYETCQTLYDTDDGSGDPELFSPAPDDEDSPHSATRIMWNEYLRGFEPLIQKGQITPMMFTNVFGSFLSEATSLLESLHD